jgi:predicted Zn finger-like uncharacterized protein
LVATCPQCHTRYRLAQDKIGPRGARIRCARCETVFAVERPAAEADAPAPVQGKLPSAPAKPVSVPARPPAVATGVRPAAPAAARPAGHESAPTWRILVAEVDAEAGQAIVALLSRWRISAQCVQDGGQALLQLHRKRPDAVVLGGHLPGLSARVVCEVVRRTAELAGVKLIRVASLDEPAGAPEFDADHVIEPAAVLDALGPILAKLGLGEAPEEQPTGAAVAAPRSGAAASAGASPDSRVAAAERLARIIVSDIILYNEAKFRAAAAKGNVTAALEHELTEASALFRKRVPEEIRATRNFLSEELETRAAKVRAG